MPIANVEPESGVQCTGSAPSTKSSAEAVKEMTAPNGPVASRVMSAGRDSAGGVVSTTPTSKVAAPVLPAASVAVQVTTVLPSEKMDPDVGEHETATDPSTISKADEENATTAPVGPVASTENEEGTVTIGGVVSTTVTRNAPVAALPAASETEQLTVVMPKGKIDPEAGAQVGTSPPSTRSEALTEYVTTAPEGPVASTLNAPGSARAGGVVSRTVILKDADPRLP